MSPIEALSPRERQCLDLLAKPMRPKEIAVELDLSVKTIEGYLATARTKLGASNSLDAARRYRSLTTGNSLGEIPRVEETPPPPSLESELAESAVSEGRIVKLNWPMRLAIIVALTVVLLASVLVVISGADVVTRMAHNYHLAHPD